MNGLTQEQLLLRNLRDAGCDEESIQQYFQWQAEGREREQLRFLSAYRWKLLEQIHINQERLDCLDYLLYTMKGQKA